MLGGHTLTQAASLHDVPYHRISYWLRHGRREDGPEEWRRFVVRLAWADSQIADHHYERERDRLLPGSPPDLGAQSLSFK